MSQEQRNPSVSDPESSTQTGSTIGTANELNIGGGVAGRDIVNVFPAGIPTAQTTQVDQPDYLRLLAVMPGAQLLDQDAVDELTCLKSLIARQDAIAHLELLESPTLAELRDHCSPVRKSGRRSAHIIHLIGRATSDGFLMSDITGANAAISVARIVGGLVDRGVKLIVWSVRGTAIPASDLNQQEDGNKSIPDLVVHNCLDRHGSAARFTWAFYRELFKGYSVVDAVEAIKETVSDPERIISSRITSELSFVELLKTQAARLPDQGALVGRAKERNQIAQYLEDPNTKAVFITGIKGLGKRALSCAAGNDALWGYPGGAYELSLDETGPDLDTVVTNLLQKLGAWPDKRDNAPQPLDTLVNRLNTRPTLTLIRGPADPARLADGTFINDLLDKLVGRLHPKGSKFLITLPKPEAAPHHSYAQEIRLEELGETDSLDLLEKRASTKKDNPCSSQLKTHAATIYNWIHGYPLLLHFAADEVLSVGWLSARNRLEPASSYNDPNRKREAIFEKHIQLLEEPGRRVLGYLPLFPSTLVSADALQAACGLEDAREVIEGLRQLIQCGLIHNYESDKGEGLYGFGQAFSDYLHQPQKNGCSKEEFQLARLRLAEHHIGRISTYSSSQLHQIHTDLIYLLEALWGNCKEVTNNDEIAIRSQRGLVALCEGLARYLCTRGPWERGLSYVEKGINTARRIPDSEASLAKLLLEAARLSRNLHRPDAINRCRESQEIYGRLSDDRNLADVLLEQGILENSPRLLKKGARLAKKVNAKETLAALLSELGRLEEDKDQEKAREYYNQAIELEKEVGDEINLADTYNKLAILELQQRKNYTEARRLLEEALGIFKKTGDEHGRALVHHNRGLTEISEVRTKGNDNQSQLLKARSEFVEAQRRWDGIGDQFNLADTLIELGSIEQDLGQVENARRYYEESIAICRTIGRKDALAHALYRLAEITQDADDQWVYYKQARTSARFIKNRKLLTRILKKLIGLAESRHDEGGAREYQHQLDSIDRWAKRR